MATEAATQEDLSDKLTLYYENGTKASYTPEEARASVADTVVLLRNSCLDEVAGCDMSDVYEALDFAVAHGATRVTLPLTDEQYAVASGLWLKDDLFGQLYPTLSQDDFSVSPVGDGRYAINMGFNSFVDDGEDHDESVARKLMQGRERALQIVATLPASCTSDYQKAEFLYDYVTTKVAYYDAASHGHDYLASGEEVCLLYDALVKGETDGAGYAYTLAYLCELAGIDAQYVTTWTGDAAEGSHEVVIASIDGDAYWFDPTGDAGKASRGFEYFGLSDEDLAQRSSYASTYYYRRLYPACTSSLEVPVGYWDCEACAYHPYTQASVPQESVVQDGCYALTSALDTSMALEVDGYCTENGGNVQIYHNEGNDFQKFRVIAAANGSVLENCGSRRVLDVAGGSAVSGNNVWQYEANGTAAQAWLLEYAGDGYYYLRSSLGDLYLEIAGDNVANCSNVQVATFTGDKNQRWRLTAV